MSIKRKFENRQPDQRACYVLQPIFATSLRSIPYTEINEFRWNCREKRQILAFVIRERCHRVPLRSVAARIVALACFY